MAPREERAQEEVEVGLGENDTAVANDDEEEGSSQDLRRRLARLRSLSPEGRGGVEEHSGREEEGDERQTLVAGLSEEEAAILNTMPQEMQDTEISFLLSKSPGTRAVWRSLPSDLRRRAAAARKHAAQEEARVRADSENEEEENGEEVDPGMPRQNREGKMALAGWLEPVVPVPCSLPHNTDGWDRIMELGGWGCGLSPFRPMAGVPAALREKWGKVVGEVLRRVLEEASGGTREALDKDLLWFLVLPQAMLRQGKRGGEKGQNVAEVGRRFDCALSRDWAGIIDLLLEDKERAEGRQQRTGRQRMQGEEDKEKKREVVLSLMSKGQVGRGSRRIVSHGVANISDPTALQAVLAKYVDRTRGLPESVTQGQCVDSLEGLRESMKDLQLGIAAGVGGMAKEFLICLAEVWNEEEMARLKEFGMLYLTAQLPPWFHRVWGTVTVVPLFKTSERDTRALRPVGVKSSTVRLLHSTVARMIRPSLLSYLEPQQLCCSPAGSHKLVHSVRMLLEQHRDWVCCKVDVENAHNMISRACILEVVEEVPSLRHIGQFLATILAPPSALETGGKLVGEAGDGLSQGDGPSSRIFAAGIHPDVRWVDEELARTGGGCARFGNNDGYLLGPPEAVFPVLATFAERIKQRCGLNLQRAKTEVLCWGSFQLTHQGTFPELGSWWRGNLHLAWSATVQEWAATSL